MKKLISLVISMLICISLTACEPSNSDNKPSGFRDIVWNMSYNEVKKIENQRKNTFKDDECKSGEKLYVVYDNSFLGYDGEYVKYWFNEDKLEQIIFAVPKTNDMDISAITEYVTANFPSEYSVAEVNDTLEDRIIIKINPTEASGVETDEFVK